MNETLSKARNGGWRNYAITAMGGALLSMVSLYVTGTQNHITREEAEKVVEDKMEVVHQKLDQIKSQYEARDKDFKGIRNSLHQMELDLSVLKAQLKEQKRWKELEFQTKPGPGER